MRAGLKPVYMVHGTGQRCGKTITLFRHDRAVEVCDQHRNTAFFQLMECGEHALQNMIRFAYGGLLVIQCVQQSENHRGTSIQGLQERGQKMRDRLLHLIAGETA